MWVECHMVTFQRWQKKGFFRKFGQTNLGDNICRRASQTAQVWSRGELLHRRSSPQSDRGLSAEKLVQPPGSTREPGDSPPGAEPEPDCSWRERAPAASVGSSLQRPAQNVGKTAPGPTGPSLPERPHPLTSVLQGSTLKPCGSGTFWGANIHPKPFAPIGVLSWGPWGSAIGSWRGHLARETQPAFAGCS